MTPSPDSAAAPLSQHIEHLAWAPLLPPWLLATLGGVCVAGIAVGLLRRASGTLWRAAGLAAILLWLAGPHLVRATWQPLPQTALLVVDQTGSMGVGQRGAIAQAAAQRLREAVGRLGIALRTVSVTNTGAGGTRLFDAIMRAAADIPRGQLAGILAVTDGEADDVPAAWPEQLSGHRPGGTPVPLQVLLAASGEQTDRRLRVLQAPPYGIIGRDATLRVEVEDLGVPAGEHATATLTLRRDGDPPLVRQVPVGAPQDITLPVDHPGPMLVELQASPLAGEVSTLNNRAVVSINGVRDRLRVLLVSGAPSQGERVWRRLLKADPSVDLVHFTILRPPDKDDTTPLNELALIAFPTRELFQEKINSFDLIILDQFENRGILPLAYLQNIADFVRGGGGLLLTAGPEFIGRSTLQDTPLGDILPAHVPEDGGLLEERFTAMPTALGRRHPVTADLPQMPGPGSTAEAAAGGSWGPWFRALRADQSHGEVLLTAPDGSGGRSPLLVLDHVGSGRAAMLLSDQIWLWSRGEGGGGPQAELLRRIAHWLMKEPELEEEQLTASVAHGRLTVTRRSVEEHPARQVTVTAPGGRHATLDLSPGADGVLSGSLPASSTGIWTVSEGRLRAFAASQPEDPVEIADLRATATRLAGVVRQSGGATTWLGDDPARLHMPGLRLVDANATAAGAGWIGLRRTGAHVVTGSTSRPLLPPWLVLPAALLALFIGWRREGRS